MRRQLRNVLLRSALCAFTVFAPPVSSLAVGADDPKADKSSDQSSPDPLNSAKKIAEQLNKQIIVIEEDIPHEKEQKPVEGPPSKGKLLTDEVQERLEWLKTMQNQAQEAIKQAEQAKDPVERQWRAKDAMLKAEAAEHMKQTITGPPPSAPAPATANIPGASSRIQFNSGAFEQLKQSSRISQEAATQRDPDAAQHRSLEAFGQGRAGAGGVALYKPATVVMPFEATSISGAVVEDERLALIHNGQKIRFPQFDPQFLAIAIRSVYGGEGLVKGTLTANEDNAVVVRTGKDQYGEVVWKKEFLPQLSQELTPGQEIALDLGPGVGALDLPEPSYERITYYGPLKGNVLGQVVQESDMVFSMFWYGIDWKTGLPLDVDKHPGYKSAIDLDLENPPQLSATQKGQPAKNWWDEIVWFVWTPNEVSLELAPGGSEFRFVKATMRVVVWSVRPDNVSAHTKAQGEFLTQHFDDFGRAFPVLERLREAAETVAVVRWLKLNKITIDQSWAKAYSTKAVDTPDKVRRYSVFITRDKSGKPLAESRE